MFVSVLSSHFSISQEKDACMRDMASVKTPPRKLNNNSQKRNLPNSPHGTETPVKAINKKVKKSDEAEEKEMIASLKAYIQDKHNKL